MGTGLQSDGKPDRRGIQRVFYLRTEFWRASDLLQQYFPPGEEQRASGRGGAFHRDREPFSFLLSRNAGAGRKLCGKSDILQSFLSFPGALAADACTWKRA